MKVPNNKFDGNPFSENQADACGQTDGHDDAKMRFSRLCDRAKEVVVDSR
jgi:hypothetical protein